MSVNFTVNNARLTQQDVINVVDQIMSRTLQYTIHEVSSWIEEYVAKRTGQLQDGLKDRLSSSSWLNWVLRLELGSNVPYMGIVNNYSASQVQHNNEIGYADYYGHEGLILLNDPKAQGKFWGLFHMHAKTRLKENFKKARLEVCGSVGMSARTIPIIKVI